MIAEIGVSLTFPLQKVAKVKQDKKNQNSVLLNSEKRKNKKKEDFILIVRN